MKFHSIPVLFLALFISNSASAQNAVEITTKFEKDKIAAIEAYLKENPEAPDIDMACSILIGAHITIGQYGEVPALLERRYELQPKGEDADLERIINEIARPYIETAIISDKRDMAKAFLTKFRNDFAESPQSGVINQYIDQMGASLYLPGVGDTMEFAFTDMNGKEFDMEKMKGKIVLVDFWATWCPPCVAEMPHLLAAYKKFHDKGFEIVGITHDETRQPVEEFVAAQEIPWSQYFDGQGDFNELSQRFGISILPATFLVGKDGKIIAVNLRGAELEQLLEEELGEADAPATEKKAKGDSSEEPAEPVEPPVPE